VLLPGDWLTAAANVEEGLLQSIGNHSDFRHDGKSREGDHIFHGIDGIPMPTDRQTHPAASSDHPA
jgi:hypothetical protein